MEIGGFFPYGETGAEENGYLSRICSQAGDMKHLMSGRCAIYLCLQDSMLTDNRRIAYLPAYTCETVSGCFVKAGYKIYYYDVDESLTPLFEEQMAEKISFLMVCGYYGYSSFDIEFVKKCRKNGVTVMQDITHTAFSENGICKETDYVVCSLRKWMGVISGGIAVKQKGDFQAEPLPKDEVHLAIRDKALKLREKYEQCKDETLNKESADAFWEAEYMLREIFDMQEGDDASLRTIRYYPIEKAVERRRENYTYLLKHFPVMPGMRPVFKKLPKDTCPMFFAVLAEDRQPLLEFLARNHIPPKVYWPVPPFIEIENYPHAQYVYSHIMSVSCDERFTVDDMQSVITAFEAYGDKSSDIS